MPHARPVVARLRPVLLQIHACLAAARKAVTFDPHPARHPPSAPPARHRDRRAGRRGAAVHRFSCRSWSEDLVVTKVKRNDDISAELVRSLFLYDPESGIFTRRTPAGNGLLPGSPAGSIDPRGYVNIMISQRRYMAHRLAWLYVHGRFPVQDIDHVNMIRSDNRLSNIRECTRSQNRANTRATRSNTSGYKGVTQNGSRWQAQIEVDGKSIYLGLFQTPKQASVAYAAEAVRQFGEFARSA
jgi:hypothetical protein